MNPGPFDSDITDAARVQIIEDPTSGRRVVIRVISPLGLTLTPGCHLVADFPEQPDQEPGCDDAEDDPGDDREDPAQVAYRGAVTDAEHARLTAWSVTGDHNAAAIRWLAAEVRALRLKP